MKLRSGCTFLTNRIQRKAVQLRVNNVPPQRVQAGAPPRVQIALKNAVLHRAAKIQQEIVQLLPPPGTGLGAGGNIVRY